MKPVRKPWGLASAGNISRTLLRGVPELHRHLGPVASTSFRLASRVVNTVHAGTPIRNLADLGLAQVIFLCVPGGELDQLVTQEFLDAIAWEGKTVLICDGLGDLRIAGVLRERGASVGSLSVFPMLPDRFVGTGDRPPARIAKAIVRGFGLELIEIPEDRLLLFASAITLSGSLFTPLLETAAECLRQTGIDQQVAAKLTDALFHTSLRAFKRAGRKGWSGPVALADRRGVDAQHRALAAVHPLMASYFQKAAHFSFELFQTYPELTRHHKARWNKQ